MATYKTSSLERVEGRNPVLEALRGPREVQEVYLARGIEHKGVISEIVDLCGRDGVAIREVSKDQLAALAETPSPQGVIAKVSPFRYWTMNQLMRSIEGHAPLVIVLDGVEDPQNFGTLLRVADAAGVDGVIVSKRRSSPVTATVAKASVGAVEHVKIVEVANIASTLSRLNQEALWIVGADLESDLMYYELDLTMPVALVLGGEGKGLSRLVKERCDYLARLPMLGNVSSLNVATAGAALLYEVVRQRRVAANP